MRPWVGLSILLAACSAHVPGAQSDAPVAPQIVRTPPPISGGTLLATSSFVYASNPDAGIVDVIDPVKGEIVWRAGLGHASEPGRLAEDASGRVHVVLRNGGAIATLDVVKRAVTTTPVCPAPRGIAVDTEIHVACAGGEIVSVPLDLSSARVIARVGRDLRDIVSAKGQLYVTRFRAAELIAVDPTSGEVLSKAVPPPIANSAPFEADAAWRTLAAPDGSVYMLHQYATSRSIDIDPSSSIAPYGSPPPPTATTGDCLSNVIVVAALTRFLDGHASGSQLFQFATGIDMSISPSGMVVSVAHLRTMPKSSSPSNAGVMVQTFAPQFSMNEPLPCQAQDDAVGALEGRAVGVAHLPSGWLAVQTRDPAELVVARGPPRTTVPLTPTITDAGSTLFHTPTRAGIACASCHPEGAEDGHTWHFTGLGPRRTQSLRGGVLDTLPLHWDGDKRGLLELMNDVFTRRMAGGKPTAEQLAALARWMQSLPPPAPPSGLDPATVDRGRARFDGAGCGTCHSGPHLTNDMTVSVGTGGFFQVPSLVGIGARAPFIHDGCAPTLHDRLTDPFCAGVKHGNLDDLTPADLSDLETFLESL